ncbi:MAG: AraC family transcriptional regulator [Adhaeribacter sp.]
MNSDSQTNIRVDLGFETNPSRPVTAYSETLQQAKCAEPHAHPRAQIISCDSGIMKVVTAHHIWIVNAMQSVWIAGEETHQVFFPNKVKVISLFIDPSKTANLPPSSFAFDHSGFLKSLMWKIKSFGDSTEYTPAQNRVMEVLLDEVSVIKPSLTFLPTSEDTRIKKVTDALMQDIPGKETIQYYADLCCVSPRTLSRLFINKVGMNFGDWRMRLKLLEAIKQLSEHKPVKEIAFGLGYENTSAFIYTFKKHFGQTPMKFLQDKSRSM